MKSNHGPRLWSRKTNTRAAAVLMIEDRPGVYMRVNGPGLARVFLRSRTGATCCRISGRVSVYRAGYILQDQDQDQDRDKIPGAVFVFPGPVPGYLRVYDRRAGTIAPALYAGPCRGCSLRRRDRVTAADPGGIIPGPEKPAKRRAKTFGKTFLKNS